MGRIRTIKPEFPQSETIGALSRDARLLFVQLWTVVDDAGRARAASRLLAGWLYPYDDDAPALIDDWLGELDDAGLVRLYRVGGTLLLDIPTWRKHQKIDRPSASKLPEFDEASRVFASPREASRGFSHAPPVGRHEPETKPRRSDDLDLSAGVVSHQAIENEQFDEASRGLANTREASMLDLGPRTLDHTSSLRSDGAAAPVADCREQPSDRVRSRPSKRPAPDSAEAQAAAAMLAEAVTGIGPATDDTPRSRLWRDGLATLARITGKSAKSLRSLVGKMRDDLAGAPGVEDPDAALLEIITRAEAERPSETIPWIAGAIRARHRPALPCANDDAEAWAAIADGIEFDKRKGRNRPVVCGYYVDVYARDVCAAAGLPQSWRGDWSPLIGWLRADIDGDGKPNIVSAIRDVASRPGYRPPAGLAYFDAAVRKPRPAAVA